ncbi:MAG: hypothetical protein IPK72_12375 [Candidatus Eisenbacteria bacterium]|nr:hypothetical protein [Candidatus Eisenbacteria bacterium]
MSAHPSRNRRRILNTLAGAAGVAAAVGLGNDPARAEEASIQIANQLEAYYDSELEESVMDDRLDATLSYGPYSLGTVFLSHSPSGPLRVDPNDFGEKRQGLWRRWIGAETEGWSVKAGHVYSTFGRGLGFSVFEDQVVDFYPALDGFLGEAEFGIASIKAVAGTADYTQTVVSAPAYVDPFAVRAFEVGLKLPRNLALGLETALTDGNGEAAEENPVYDRIAGGHLGTSLGGRADLYGEYVVRDANYRDGDEGPAQGHAGYASATFYLGRVQVLSEFKDLLRYDVPFVNAPTVVRQHTSTLLNRGGHTPNIQKNDERGGLVEALVTVNEATRVVGSFSRSEARHAYTPAREVYGEIERWLTERAELIVRAAETEEVVLEGGDEIFFERITYGGNLLLPLDESYSLDLGFETQGTQEQNRATRDFRKPVEFRDTLISATLSRAPNMSFAVTTEWTDSPKETDDFWLWGEWNLRVGSRHQLLLGGGKLRGGQLCSGGVCKLVDPFEGGRIEFLTTF